MSKWRHLTLWSSNFVAWRCIRSENTPRFAYDQCKFRKDPKLPSKSFRKAAPILMCIDCGGQWNQSSSPILLILMSVLLSPGTGGGGGGPRGGKLSPTWRLGEVSAAHPTLVMTFAKSFVFICLQCNFVIFKMKWAKSDEKTNFGWVVFWGANALAPWLQTISRVPLNLPVCYPRPTGVFFITKLTGGAIFCTPSDLRIYWSNLKNFQRRSKFQEYLLRKIKFHWPRSHRWRHRSSQRQNVDPFQWFHEWPLSRQKYSWQGHKLTMNRHDVRLQHQSTSFWAFSNLGSGQGHLRSKRSILWFASFNLTILVFGLFYRPEIEKWPKNHAGRIEQRIETKNLIAW